MLTYFVFGTLLVVLAGALASALHKPERRLLGRFYAGDLKDAIPAHLQLWAAIVTLSAIEVLATRPEDRVVGPVYLALNFFCVFVLLLLVTWWRHAQFHICLADTSEASLLHLFAHVVCAVYVRIASWLLFTGSAS